MRRLIVACFLIAVVAASETMGVELDNTKTVSRLLFGSCIKQDRPTSIFHTMLAERPDLVVFTGDNIYGDTDDMSVLQEKYQKLASNRLFAKLRSSAPFLATWDDHDYGVNDGGADFPKRAASQEQFLKFWNVPTTSPRWNRPGVYHAERIGPPGECLQIILLDTRYFRSTLKKGERRVGGPYVPDEDPGKTMLGSAQWQWLERQLSEPADLRVIVSSVQFAASASGQECWANLPRERTRLLNLIESSEAKGVLLISGDRHWSELSVVSQNVPYPIYDLTCSSLNQIHGRGTPTENEYRASQTTFHRENYGVMEIEWAGDNTAISLSVRDMEGKPRINKSLRLSELR